ncbi:MAG: sugar ABC transporter permease [Anaerolineae bacterium]
MLADARDPAKPKTPALAAPTLLMRLQGDNVARMVFLLPSVLLVLFLAVFPLLASLYLSVSRVQLVRGGFNIEFIGLRNFERLLSGSEQRRFLGRFTEFNFEHWLVLGAVVLVMVLMLVNYVRSPRFKWTGIPIRLVAIAFGTALTYLFLATLTGRGLPGTLVVTMIFVFAGVTLQYLLGLGLAMLLTQELPGKRFFRIIFLLPMMITPVGIAFLFRMMTDTLQGPLAPLWALVGLRNFSWVETAEGARLAVVIGDTWQWTPFMFIILLAALEGVSRETIEAALVDGANRVQLFFNIILPEILPVSITLILIRIIESFKIIDMPQVLTRGGPGTATEPVSLHAYNIWRAGDWGGSAALSYLLLIIVTFVALVFVNSVRRRVLEWV